MNAIRDTWFRAMNGDGERQRVWFFELACAYSEAGRHYHTLSHVIDLAAKLLAIEAIDPAAYSYVDIYRAIWWHDYVYNSRAVDNEERSGEAMSQALLGCGVSPIDCERASTLVMYTKAHQVPEDDADGRLLADLDLSILAASPDRYVAYANAIREEYAWVSDRDFASARSFFLRSMLDSQRPIFSTRHFGIDCDSVARSNMLGELQRLTSESDKSS